MSDTEFDTKEESKALFGLFLALALLVAACIGCAPTWRVYSPQPEAGPLVHEAAQLYGVRAKMMDKPGPGVVYLTIEKSRWDPEKGAQLCGTALEKVFDSASVRDALTGGIVDCEPKAWSCATVTFVAHELGHVYGLPHTVTKPNETDMTEAGNVMQWKPGKSKQLTQRQKTIVKLAALGLEEACRARPRPDESDPE